MLTRSLRRQARWLLRPQRALRADEKGPKGSEGESAAGGQQRAKAAFEHLVRKDEVKSFLPQLLAAILSTLLLAGFMRVIDNILKPSPVDRRINSLTRALEKHPDSAAAAFRLGIAYLHKAVSSGDAVDEGSLELAVAMLGKAHTLEPKAQHIAASYAESLLIAGRPSDAVAVLQPIVQQFATSANGRFQKATPICIARYMAAAAAQRQAGGAAPSDALGSGPIPLPGMPSSISTDPASVQTGVQFSQSAALAAERNPSVDVPAPTSYTPTSPLPTHVVNDLATSGRPTGFATAAALVAVQSVRETAAKGGATRGLAELLEGKVCPRRGEGKVPLYRDGRGLIDSATGTSIAGDGGSYGMYGSESSYTSAAQEPVHSDGPTVVFGDGSTSGSGSPYKGGLDMSLSTSSASPSASYSAPSSGSAVTPEGGDGVPMDSKAAKRGVALEERGFGPYLDRGIDAPRMAAYAAALCHVTVADLKALMGESGSERLEAARSAAAAARASHLQRYVDSRFGGQLPVW